MVDYSSLSLWHDTAGEDFSPRPGLSIEDIQTSWDVVIIGAGYTGLWTALGISELNPDARVLILEKEVAGFGASGRNGGWCSALFPSGTRSLIKKHGVDQATALRQAMVDTVSDVGRWSSKLGIECDFVIGGTTMLAVNEVQEARAKDTLAEAALAPADKHVWLEAADTLQATGVRGAVFNPSCARVHPIKLVRGLARAIEERGIRIAEGTEVLDYSAHTVLTSAGALGADIIVDAMEGYRSQLKPTRRHSLPLYSLMIATEPLPDSVFDDIGLTDGMTFSDFRSLIIYGQRTSDNRIAFGGRGAPYHFASTIKPEFDRVPRVFSALQATLGSLFPQVAKAPISHTWGGVLGVPRDWHSSVTFDASTGIARAGGYVGDGVGLSHLAGFSVADLVTGTVSHRTSLPFVNHQSPRWEPEPLRYLGAMAAIKGVDLADRIESRTGKRSIVTSLIAPLTGH
jgi:glycine/D-amino acid oxidase-like deaminating enzyme